MTIRADVLTTAFATMRAAGCTIDSEKWTETDTRSKFIDTVLIDCLGWSESDIKRELAQSDDRLDYLLSTNVAAVVVEAKRASIELPVSKQRGIRRLKLERLLDACPTLKTGVSQAAGYCHRWSAPIAILTNGRTWIAFIGSRVDRIPWLSGDAIVIPDLFSDDIDFGEFHGLLSKQAVMEGHPMAALTGGTERREPVSVLARYEAPNALIPNNPIGVKLEPLLNQVFSDVAKEDSREILERCYVPPTETGSREDEFNAMLLDGPPLYVKTASNVGSANAYRKFREHLKEQLSRQTNREGWSQTILVIGGVGAGKTFFLKRHFGYEPNATDVQPNAFALYVDFRKPELDPTRLPDMVWRKLREQIEGFEGKPVPGEHETTYELVGENALRTIFWADINKFEKIAGRLKESDPGAYDKALVDRLLQLSSDDRAYVVGACRTLRQRYHRQVCVILDNADQCEPDYQKAVYLFARTLESELQCLVLVALREEWYWHFGVRPDGPMSAYNNTVYHIPAPPLREVISKRLQYAIELVERDMGSARFDVGAIEVQAESLSTYLRSVEKAFHGNLDIAVFHEAMANGSVRRGLDVFLEFIRSGHTKVSEYLPAIVKNVEYVLQFHQVFKPIAFGSFRYYGSHRSLVPNLVYPVENAGGWISYFARAYFVRWLVSKAKLNSPAGVGFVGLNASKAFLEAMGLDDPTIDQLIRQAVVVGLAEPDVRILEAVDHWTHLRATTKGAVFIQRLLGRLAYWEAVMLDTPLNDQAVLDRISALYMEGTTPAMHQRVRCVQDFLAFLQNTELLEQNRIRSSRIATDCPLLMPSVAEMMKTEYERLASVTQAGGT